MEKQIKNNMNRKGFTLVELLVVVAIIAILSTIGLVVFSDAQKNARDARRKSDIDAIAKAIESKRVPGAASYSNIVTTDFSSGAVPTDTTTSKYVIQAGASVIGDPTNWGTTVSGDTAAPSLPGTWVPIPADLTGITIAGSTYWKVCARLENSGSLTAVNNTSGNTANTHTYCKGSAQ